MPDQQDGSAEMSEAEMRELLTAALRHGDDAWNRGDAEECARWVADDVVVISKRRLSDDGAIGREAFIEWLSIRELPVLRSELVSVHPPSVYVTRAVSSDRFGNEGVGIQVVRVSNGLVVELVNFDDDVAESTLAAEVDRLLRT